MRKSDHSRRIRRELLITALAISVGIVIAIVTGTQTSQSESDITESPGMNHLANVSQTCPDCKRPPRDMRWNYQLQGTVRVAREAQIYDVDGFDTPRSTIRRIHRAGGYAVCYVNAGAWEDWRPDADRFSTALLGAENGWPGERWLDIRATDDLAPLLRERFKLCKQKGFDAVEPDNVDAWQNDSGFAISAGDQRRFNLMLVRLAHQLKLAVALKNDLDQAASLAPHFDFAIVEECVQYRACARTRSFTRRRKAVLAVEYLGTMRNLCRNAKRHGFAGLLQTPSLDRRGRQCPDPNSD